VIAVRDHERSYVHDHEISQLADAVAR